MTVSVLVQRAPADNQGDDIADPLIASEAQAEARGRADIDKNFSDRVMVSGTCVFSPYIQPGKMVLVTDLQIGQYMAKLKSFNLTISRQINGSLTAMSNIVMEREKSESGN